MIENGRLFVPFEEFNDCAAGEYYELYNNLKGEFLLIQNDDGNFYFLCSTDSNIEKYCWGYGWYIVSKANFNDRLYIGHGLSEKEHLEGEFYRVRDNDTLQLWKDILCFVFTRGTGMKFFPFDNHFAGETCLDGSPCFYLHDYYPTYCKNLDQKKKKVSNLIFRFKEGDCGGLVAKLFSLAIGRMSFYLTSKNPILIPIPASTRERQIQRYAKFCYSLAAYLKIEDGYRAIWIEKDREQLKGSIDQDKISNLCFKKDYIIGKDIILVDDIMTTGQSFIQIKQKMEDIGASSVVGVFLGKTV